MKTLALSFLHVGCLLHQAENGARALGQPPMVDSHEGNARLSAAGRSSMTASGKKQTLRQFHLKPENHHRKHEGVVHDKFL
jgi:hypothetical protein